MARGFFDPGLERESWFDPALKRIAWFDKQFVTADASGGPYFRTASDTGVTQTDSLVRVRRSFLSDIGVKGLTDAGLLCRYYLNEASSGSGPTQINDQSLNAYHLTDVNYGSGNMLWTTTGVNKGLDSTVTTGTQRARRTIHDSSDVVRDAIHGAQKCTFEVVFELHAHNASTGRVFAINDRVGGGSRIGPVCNFSATSIQWYFNSGAQACNWTVAAGRNVLHFVVDTTQATPADRVKCYRNGTQLTTNVNTMMAQDATISLGSGLDLIIGNRESTGTWDRALDGITSYAALYSSDFNQARVTEHFNVLNTDDDQVVDSLVAIKTKVVTLTDTGVTNTDSITKFASKVISDTGVTNTDTLLRIRRGVLTDTGLTPSDSLLTLRRRFLTDTGVTNTDTFTRIRRGLLSDTGVTQTDTLLRVRQSFITDTGLTQTDVLDDLRRRFITDTGVTQSDDLVAQFTPGTTGYNRTATDTGITQTDSLLVRRNRVFTDTGVTQTDSLVPTYTRILTDTGITPSETLVTRRARLATDTGVTPGESLVRLLLAARPPTDTGVTQTDSLLRRPTRVLTDTGTTTSDSFLRTLSRFISDTGVSFSDVLRPRISRFLTDTVVTPSDVIARVRTVPRTITDTGVTNTDSLITLRRRILTDTGITFSDALKRLRSGQLIDTLAFSDSLDAFKSQLFHPISDISTGTWTVAPLWSKVDDDAPGTDGEFISSALSPLSPDITEMALTALGDPGRDDGHKISYRISKSTTTDALQLTVRLMQGAVEIKSWVVSSVSETITTYEQTLTTAEASAITNYGNLRIILEAVKV